MKERFCERNEGKRVTKGEGRRKSETWKIKKNALDSLIKKNTKMPIRSLKYKEHRNVSFFRTISL